MRITKVTRQGQSGSITWLACCLSVLVVGVISYSLIVGQVVQKKIQLQNHLDIATLATAHHSAQGLNMMAANNLALAASFHIAAAVPVLEAYLSIVYAMTSDGWDSLEEVLKDVAGSASLGVVKAADRYQKAVWNKLGGIISIYMRLARGFNELNSFLARYWMWPAAMQGTGLFKLNQPDGVSLFYQGDWHQMKLHIPAPQLKMQYPGLKKAETSKSLCHSLKASTVLDESLRREDFAAWLLGPFLTLDSSSATVAQRLANLIRFVDRYLPVNITFVDCGYGIRSPLLQLVRGLSQIPLLLKKGLLADLARDLDASAAIKKAQSSHQVAGSKPGLVCQASYRAMQADALARGTYWTRLVAPSARREYLERVYFSAVLEKLSEQVRKTPEEPQKSQYRCIKRNLSNHIKAKFWGLQTSRLYPSMQQCQDAEIAQWQRDYMSWVKQRSPYYCEIKNNDGEVIERKYGQIPYQRPDGQVCLNLRTLPYYCPLLPYIQEYRNLFVNLRFEDCRKFSRRIARWKAQCRAIFGSDGLPQKNNDLQIVSWKKQIETYLGRSTNNNVFHHNKDSSERAMDDLGFVVVSHNQLFENGQNFVGMGALLAYGDYDDQKICSQLNQNEPSSMPCALEPLVSLAQGIKEKKQGKSLTGWQQDFVKVLHGGMYSLIENHQQAMIRGWGTSFWAISHARVQKKKSHVRHLMFWPDFYPRLHAVFVWDQLQAFENFAKPKD